MKASALLLLTTTGSGRVEVERPAPVPVSAMVLGRPVTEAVELLPRLFNLCRETQALCARMALGSPEVLSADALGLEIMREHLTRLLVFLPRICGMENPHRAFAGMAGAEVLRTVFGPGGSMPDASGWDQWLESGEGVAPLARRIDRMFAPGEAVAELPCLDCNRPFYPVACENSPASFFRQHPVLRRIEERRGRGPLWRLAGVLAQVEALANGKLPFEPRVADGVAVVPAARGAYAIRATRSADMVTGFARLTPTDCLLAMDGVLDRCLATLRDRSLEKVRLLAGILDPCVAFEVREAADA